MNDYEKLGLKESSSKEQIQRAYKVKLLQFQKLGEKKTKEDEEKFNEIDQAYNRLCGYDVVVEEEPHQKVKDFFSYHKEVVLIVSVVILFVAVFLFQIIGNEKYDVLVSIIGEFGTVEKSEYVGVNIADRINKLIVANSEMDNIYTEYYRRGKNFVRDKAYNEQQVAITAKMMGNTFDLLILDEENFLEYTSNGYLADLSKFIGESSLEVPEDIQANGTTEENIYGTYGIELTDNYVINEIGLKCETKVYACIYVGSENKENSFEAIRVLASDFQK